MESKLNLKNDNDDFAILPDGILYRKDYVIQAHWSDGTIETWSQNYGLTSAIENFESMALRWNETDESKQRRKFNKFAMEYLRNIPNAVK